MATQAHCAYCFESLSASFEKRKPQSLQRIEELWSEYISSSHDADSGIDSSAKAGNASTSSPLSRLRDGPSSLFSSSSSESSSIATSKSSTTAPASSNTSTSSINQGTSHESHPLFITWNTISGRHSHSLRGCIGCFSPLPLPTGLRDYALTAAFEDHRFQPIPASLLPSLQVCVTLLTNFSAPDRDPLNWTVGEHGIRLSFVDKGRRYGSTYLPDVAKEQGWNQQEAVLSLMRKAGWNGRKESWRSVQSMEIVRYEGKKVHLDFAEWKEFDAWVKQRRG